MANLSEFLARSYVIRDATEEGENTADRVGGCFVNAGDVFTELLAVKSSNGRITTFEDNAIVCEGNKVTFGTNWDMFHGNGYYAAGGNVAVPQTVTVGAASGVVYLDLTDNTFRWTTAVGLLGEKAIIVARTKDDAVVEMFANRYMLDGKVNGGGIGGTDMQTVWTEMAADGAQQINVSHLRNALASCTWWGAQMAGNAVTGSLSDVINITMSGRLTIGGFVIEYDSGNNALKFGGDIYATGGVTALGYQSGGGGGDVSLNEPLSSINNAQLGAPTTAGVSLVWDGTAWSYGQVSGGTGTVTRVTMSTPTGLQVNLANNATITTQGAFNLSYTDGYSIPLTDDVAKGVSAYGWGNHASAGYATQSWVNNKDYATEAWVEGKGYTTNAGTVTSVGLSVPTGFSVSGSPVTSSGTLSLRFASGYSLPTTTKQSQWDTAYGWGNHASAGYITQTAADGRYVTLATTQTVTGEKTFTNEAHFTNNLFLDKNGAQYIRFIGASGKTAYYEQNASGNLVVTSTSDLDWYTYLNGNLGLFVDGTNGYVGVGNNAPAYNCDVTGVIRATDSIIIGDGKIAWDATNNALYVQKKDGSVCHFYSLGGVSALGVGSGSGASISTMKVSTLNATNVNANEIVTSSIKPTQSGIIDLWTSDNNYYWEFGYQDTYGGTTYYALDCYNVGLYGENSNADNTWRITPEGFAEFSTVKCGGAQLLSNYVYINALVRLRANGSTVYLETRTSQSASWTVKETWS